ncbi:TPA: right-handed parallel beta-helix repeat-containing protein [Serratia liquefaciens]|uniref:right-handed parallel beta-helix repeat-containing protein n=1 Tax=Serratia liquefaciens TaxID=614 RepID=UPI00101F2764|nr:right-handed parallel beta-helix repeat-containing protein [Serratia liquefaciens]MDU4172369.1 right-handed parallel beta-helix repeat-containing protein [Serratia liquefaciens]
MERRLFLKRISILTSWGILLGKCDFSFGQDSRKNSLNKISFNDVKNNIMPSGVDDILIELAAHDYDGSFETTLVRNKSEDNHLMAGKNWSDVGLVNKKALVFDAEGKAFSLTSKNGIFSIESLGGGIGQDDSSLMEIAQYLSSKPVHLVKNKVYYYSKPVSHTVGFGWIGNHATIKFLPRMDNEPRVPFITSPATDKNIINDSHNSSTGVKGVLFKDLTIDTNYNDYSGKVGFLYAENTLDNWSSCQFDNVSFINSKFDNLALQNNCRDIIFSRCTFNNSGEDGVTIRKNCNNIKFIDSCVFSNTAKVQSGGDGIVVKGSHISVIGCRFENIGIGKKGAAIANNAEDADNAEQASYGVFNHNYFLNCHGGLGIGTVKSSLAFSNDWISNITASNNIFENVGKVAIGARYVHNFTSHHNVIKNQTSAKDFAVELLHVTGADCDFSVSQSQGGTLHLRDCSGGVKLSSTNVALAGFNNAVFIEKCVDVKVELDISNSGRGGCYIDTISSSTVSIKAIDIKGVALQVINSINTNFNSTVVNSAFDGVILRKFKNIILNADIKNTGTTAKGKYNSVGVYSGNGAVLNISSDSNNANYDLFVDKSSTGIKMSPKSENPSILRTNYNEF